MIKCPKCKSEDVLVAIHTDYKQCKKCFRFWEESNLVSEYLDRLENYHGEDVSWHRKNNSDADTLRDELIELGDDEFVNLKTNKQ